MCDLGVECTWEFTDEELGILAPNDNYNDDCAGVYSDEDECPCGFGDTECKKVCDGSGPCICFAALK